MALSLSLSHETPTISLLCNNNKLGVSPTLLSHTTYHHSFSDTSKLLLSLLAMATANADSSKSIIKEDGEPRAEKSKV